MGSSAKRPRSAAVPDPALAPTLLKPPSPAAPADSPVAKSHGADNEASFAWPALEDLGLLPAEDEAVLPEREEEGSSSNGAADEVDDARIIAGALC
ncbi:hypothetical protein DMC30DRAFT_417145 [Rhodotorula diobovata]|uniref:Uncharacterized protein n=1 Tax=Rhodotorula diobovata TaxID=5288 RepID=A0A5C5FTW8_9BASI|nr:hypothetical protein DMC30DRAFT_417145 [Rhodotorula diobovata]